MTDRYTLRTICGADCEWDTFIVGEPCGNVATTVILDANDTSEYPEGFHVAHLCDEHATRGLGETIGMPSLTNEVPA